jgi:hypothetical protein
MTNTADIFRTKELSLAAYLVSKGIKYLGPEPITETSYYLTFENLDKCLELEREFVAVKQHLLKGFDYRK